MSLWNARKDEAAIDRAEHEREQAGRSSAREEGLPPHTEEVIQPRQYPPGDSGVDF